MSYNSKDLAHEFWACLSLQHAEGLGAHSWKRLVDFYGSAAAAVQNPREWPQHDLVNWSITKIYLQEKWREIALDEWSKANKLGLKILLYVQKEYPERLRQIASPPLYLYYRGNLDLLQKPCLAMVGSRICSKYGLQYAAQIASDLSQAGITVVSGLAMGIDRQSHYYSLAGPGKSIAVLGTGIDLVYPARNSDLWTKMTREGLIISEFSPGMRAERRNFPRRNRIISGLSLGVLVVEAAEKSGSLITANKAIEQNREVFALPGPLHLTTYEGCNALIRQGATLVRSAEDIIEQLSPILQSEYVQKPAVNNSKNETDKTSLPPRAEYTDLMPDEKKITEILSIHTKTHIDVIAKKLGWESNKVSQILLMLELKGVIKQSAGMYYSLV